MVFPPSPMSLPQQPHGGGGTPAEMSIRRDMKMRQFPEVFGRHPLDVMKERHDRFSSPFEKQKREWIRQMRDMPRDIQEPPNSRLPLGNIRPDPYQER